MVNLSGVNLREANLINAYVNGETE
ncbi:pentapeptide repeat-containing protein [Phormidium sp. CLA17]|nr:pentapeptide repeat-containing protein [Leptolyngbya sp. Cla-17]